MMRSRDCGQPAICGPVSQRSITGNPGFSLKVSGRQRDLQGRMGHTQRSANACGEGGFIGSFGPEAMIDCGRLDPARHGGMGEQQQRHTIRPARHCHTQRAARRAQRRQIGSKARGQFG